MPQHNVALTHEKQSSNFAGHNNFGRNFSRQKSRKKIFNSPKMHQNGIELSKDNKRHEKITVKGKQIKAKDKEPHGKKSEKQWKERKMHRKKLHLNGAQGKSAKPRKMWVPVQKTTDRIVKNNHEERNR